MRDTKVEQVGSFVATDAQGKKHTVFVLQQFELRFAYQSAPEWAAGMKTLVLESGEHLNHVGKGRYETINGLQFTSNDPDAF